MIHNEKGKKSKFLNNNSYDNIENNYNDNIQSKNICRICVQKRWKSKTSTSITNASENISIKNKTYN